MRRVGVNGAVKNGYILHVYADAVSILKWYNVPGTFTTGGSIIVLFAEMVISVIGFVIALLLASAIV